VIYFYDGQRIVETRLAGAPTVAHQQFIYGTQYIDELVMMRVRDKGDLYVQQDANWNVIGTTDLGRHVVERSVYTPYGELTVHQDTGFGDRDGDQDVDSTDKGTVGTTCTGTVTGSCRILDLDFDGDYDSTDATKFDSLTQGTMRHPGRPATNVSQPFAHQGLLFEPELAQYQNRARQHDPGKRRFAQRDPHAIVGTPGSGYSDGLGLYLNTRANPILRLDPSGYVSHLSFHPRLNMFQFHYQIAIWGEGAPDTWQGADESMRRRWNQGHKLTRYYPPNPDACPVFILFRNRGVYWDDTNGDMVDCNSVSFGASESVYNLCYEQSLQQTGSDFSLLVLGPGDAPPGQAGAARGRRMWSIYSGAADSVSAHELGHLMGAPHCGHPDHVMHPYWLPWRNQRAGCDNVAHVLSVHTGDIWGCTDSIPPQCRRPRTAEW